MAGNVYHDELLLSIRKKAPKRPDGKPHYGIPHGGLYTLISYPNYFCEWVEWIGFALACSVDGGAGGYVSPPWLFVWSEVCVMLPRAVNGHRWYRAKFGDYPRGRKAAIPFIL